jgi:hypothetical protein
MANEMQKLRRKLVKIYFDKMKTAINSHDLKYLDRFSETFGHYHNLSVAASEDFRCATGLWERLEESDSLSPHEDTLISVFIYLLLAEGTICNHLNFVTFLLVTIGHDLYSLTRRKYVNDNIDEIRKVELSTKIQFLKHHGFGALTKEYDSTLRNDIAHHNYKIDKKGNLWIRGKTVDLESKLDPLIKMIDFFSELTEEISEKSEILADKVEKEVEIQKSKLKK